MDPSLSDVSQQKTSPNSDPAALMQLTSELTAQASQLASHQHQLQRLTTLTEELVTALQGLRITQPQTAANPPPVPANPPTMQIPSVSPRLAFPERFDGDSTNAKASYYNARSSSTNNRHFTPLNLVASPLCAHYSPAKLWTELRRYGGPMAPPSLPSTHFSITSGRCLNIQLREEGAGEQLLALSQGRKTAADYALSFRTLRHKPRGWRIP